MFDKMESAKYKDSFGAAIFIQRSETRRYFGIADWRVISAHCRPNPAPITH